MKNSILGSILDFRKTILTDAENQNKCLALLAGTMNQADAAGFVGQINDAYGNVLNLKVDENYDVTVKIACIEGVWQQGNGKLVLNESLNTLNEMGYEQLVTYDDCDYPMDLAQFQLDVAYGENENECLAQLCSKYVTTNQAQASDLINIVNNSNLRDHDRVVLTNALSQAADQDGKVSNYAFLSILRQATEKVKNTLNNGGLVMDDSEVFYLKDFICTAFLEITSTLVNLIATMLTIVSRLLGFVLMAIGFILSAIGQVFTKFGEATKIAIIDEKSSTTYFNAPITSKIYNISDFSTSARYQLGLIESIYPELAEGCAICFSCGNIDSFVWWDETHFYINEFLSLNIHLTRAWTWALSNYSFTMSSGHTIITRAIHPDNKVDCFPESCYLTINEQAEILSHDVDYVGEYIAKGFFLSCLALLNHAGQQIDLTYSANVVGTDASLAAIKLAVGDYGYISGNTFGGDQNLTQILPELWMNYVLQHMGTPLDNNSLYACSLTGFDFDLITKLVITYHDSISGTASRYDNPFYNMAKYYNGYEVTLSNQKVDINLMTQACFGWAHALLSTAYVLDYADMVQIYDSIPQDRLFRFNYLSQAELIKTYAIIGITIATFVIGTMMVSKAIKRHTWIKGQKRQREIAQARKEIYESDGQISDEQWSNFYKQVKKYNFQAKLFGWDSYDAGNGWFNAASDGESSDLQTGISQIIKLIH